MRRGIRRGLAFLFLLLWLPAGALALTGQNISTFLTYYKEDVTYINENQDRHMLPIEFETTDLKDGGRIQYSVRSDALNVTITADGDGIIESCEIRLLYPEGAQPGNSLYLDYATAQFHSLALIMAMHVSTDPASRIYLAVEIRDNLIANQGVYDRQLGSYTINCIRVVGEGAVYMFTNDGLSPAVEEPADGGPTPEPLDDSERFG
ncbi:MAG: hypothetical protein IH607_06625 [Firmicutes bacterium]|nr:hypothetical protein [Bacillota bacterium]